MTDKPFPINTPAENTNIVINDAMKIAGDLAAKAIETAIEVNVPFFALPVIKQVEEWTIEEIVGEVEKQASIGLQQIGTFVIIDTQISSEKKGISQALAALMLAEKSGDQNAIQAAIAAYQKAQSALVNVDGAAPVVTK